MNNKKGNKKGNKQAGYIGAAIYSIILALPFFELFESYIAVAVMCHLREWEKGGGLRIDILGTWEDM